MSWYETAVGSGPVSQWLLAEDEDGNLLVPAPRKRPSDVDGPSPKMWWSGCFDRRKPWHWPFWLHSRLTKNIVMVERP